MFCVMSEDKIVTKKKDKNVWKTVGEAAAVAAGIAAAIILKKK